MQTSVSNIDQILDARALEVSNREKLEQDKLIQELREAIEKRLSTQFLFHLKPIDYRISNNTAKAIFTYLGKSIGIMFSTTDSTRLMILLGNHQAFSVAASESLKDALLDVLLMVRKEVALNASA